MSVAPFLNEAPGRMHLSFTSTWYHLWLLVMLQKVIVNVNKYESGLGVSKHIGCILCCQVQSWWLCFTGWATTNIEQVNHVWTPPALKPPDRIHICWVRQYIFSSENQWFIRPGNSKELWLHAPMWVTMFYWIGYRATVNKSKTYDPNLLWSPRVGFIFVEFAKLNYHHKIIGNVNKYESDLGASKHVLT